MYIYICTLYIYSGDGHESHGKREIPVGNHYLSDFKSSTLRCTSIAHLIYTVSSFLGHVSCCTRPKMSNLCMLLICSNWQAFLLYVISVARCRHIKVVSLAFFSPLAAFIGDSTKMREPLLMWVNHLPPLQDVGWRTKVVFYWLKLGLKVLRASASLRTKNTLTCPPFVSNSQ